MFRGRSTSYDDMNTEPFKKMLLDKRQELLAEIPLHDEEAREGTNTEVEDPIDQVVSSGIKAGSFHENSLRRETLADIDDALRRMDEGTYGVCIDCGRLIEQARLEAVPWTPYCLQDQERRESEEPPQNDTLLR